MATKKTTTPKAEKVDRVVVHLPRANKGEEKFETASVNGKVYQIAKGVPVEIPVEIAEVLNSAEEQGVIADDYAETKAQ